MQNINLLNIKLKKELQPLSAQKMGKYFVLMIVVSIFAYSYFAYQFQKTQTILVKSETKLKDQEAVLQKLQQANKPKEKDPTLPYIIRQAESDILGYQLILAELRVKEKNTHKYSEYFEALAKNKVDGIWVNDFYISSFTKEMVIGGGTTQPEYVSEFIRQLSQDKTMENQTFQMLQMVEGNITALYSPFAGGSGGGGSQNGQEVTKAPFLHFKLESSKG